MFDHMKKEKKENEQAHITNAVFVSSRFGFNVRFVLLTARTIGGICCGEFLAQIQRRFSSHQNKK